MINSIIPDTCSSIQFLSRIPLPKFLPHNKQVDFQKTAHSFPLAGLLIALPAACVLWGASQAGLSSSSCSLLAIAVLILTTGALHEDGLADVADGFGGGSDKKRKLEIMRDSSIGTYGAVALILSIGLKVSLLSSLLDQGGSQMAALLLLSIASLSRFSILQPWNALLPARTEKPTTASKKSKNAAGLSALYGAPDINTILRAVLFSLPAALILIFAHSIWGFIAALIISQVIVYIFTRVCEQQIGGHTGDTLGATQQFSELGLLLGLVITV